MVLYIGLLKVVGFIYMDFETKSGCKLQIWACRQREEAHFLTYQKLFNSMFISDKSLNGALTFLYVFHFLHVKNQICYE